VAEASGSSGRRGPLVHRSVRHGAILLVVGTVQFLVGMAVTQVGWTTHYSLLQNYISDLGAVNCGNFPASSTHYVCSPWHVVFNISIVLLGLLLALAAMLIRSAFPARGTRSLGLVLLVVAGLGSIGVGLSPEDVNLTVHSLSASAAFVAGNLALLVLAFAMFRDTRWDGFRVYSLLSGLIGLVAFVLFLENVWGPLGVGGMERLIVAPVLLWSLVVGIHLARIPTYAPPRLIQAHEA
jgi:hypothetical membrane protein